MIEDLFKKANKEKIELRVHQEKLKSLLLRNDYFKEEKESWDWKLSLSSLAFSAIVMFFAFGFFGGYNTGGAGSTQKAGNNFYATMSNNKNVTSVGGSSSENVLQMVENDTRTVFYFNNRNVLVHSEVINSK